MPNLENPWIAIRECDYIGHMSSPAVGQRAVLNQLAKEVFETVRPRAALVLGCSTGNGFEHVDPALTKRIVAVDVNRQFLDTLRAQPFPARTAIEVRCADVETLAFESRAFDLVHAALLFEYVDWRPLVPRVATALAPGGILSVVVQRPSLSTAAVTPTGFTSLRTLERVFHFVDPDELVERGTQAGLAVSERARRSLPGDKVFESLRFRTQATASQERLP